MPSELRLPRLAVLVDADNASAKIVDGLFEEIAKIGKARVRRAAVGWLAGVYSSVPRRIMEATVK